jgi:UDP-N-acetylmuramate--alanine ligase
MSLLQRTRKVYFVGIGGIGMSGIAEILLRSGHQVSGSDLGTGEVIDNLKSLGAKIQKGHGTDLILQTLPDVLVFSTAIPLDNPELVFARDREIPIVRRAEMLGELMRLRRGIGVAGSHGKTTTTGVLSLILKEAGLDPAVVIGGRFDAIGSNAAWGKGQWLVAEADESDGSFLRLTPEIAIVTNVDREHLNHYGSFEAAIAAFEEFLDRLPFYGRAILCSDCSNLRAIGKHLNKPRFWYGLEKEHLPDFWVEIKSLGAQSRFALHRRDRSSKNSTDYKLFLEAEIEVPGAHNVLNASAAAIAATELEVPKAEIVAALKKFRGVRRRFENRGNWKQHTVIEDYAHHPTEIRATLLACLTVYKQAPLVIFQPHRFSRTRDSWEEFANAFEGAAAVLNLPIYAASEPRELWVEELDGNNFSRNVKNVPAIHCEDFEKVLSWMRAEDGKAFEREAPILVMGAGDVPKIIPRLLEGV